MLRRTNTVAAVCGIVGLLAMAAHAQPTGGSGGQAGPDPWPRQYQFPDARVLVFQPQLESWEGNQLRFRVAVGATPADTKTTAYGVIWGAARTEVDPMTRLVRLADMSLERSNFPTLADNGAGYLRELQRELPAKPASISLDRLEASLAASRTVKAAPVQVDNRPPEIIISYTPAVLIPIDGNPVIHDVSGTWFQRVINTEALILKERGHSTFYLHLYNGWLKADSLVGTWERTWWVRPGADQLAADLAAKGEVDLLDGTAKGPRPSLDQGVPAVHVSQAPTELIVFKGQPNFQPIGTTDLLWAANTTSDVLFSTGDNNFYVLISGRWYRSGSAQGPWSFVASNELPPAFDEIPPSSPAGVVLAAVAGTSQAEEAVIANSIPRTATLPLKNPPGFSPVFDGGPQLRPIEGTQLHYVVNSPEPIIEVDPSRYYALRSGIWFTTASLDGPWTVATSVPEAIYTIPPSSPLHYVTYVDVYGTTGDVVSVGYTPGYLGTVVAPDGTVVYGTGYNYQPWVGSTWYPPPETYGVQAQPVYNPAVGWAYGVGLGLTTAAIADSWGSQNYYSNDYHGYPCCGSTSVDVYGGYRDVSTSGTESWYSDSNNTIGRDYSGSYTNYRTGTTGNLQASQSYDTQTGATQDSMSRTFNTPEGTSGDVQRSASYNPQTDTSSRSASASETNASGVTREESRSGNYDAQTDTSTYSASGSKTGPGGAERSASASKSYDAQTGQSSYDTSRSTTTAGGSEVTHEAETTDGSAQHETTTYNAKTGETQTYDHPYTGAQHYASNDGQVYRNSGDGWERNTSSGWQHASGDTSWADREQQARSEGADRFSRFAGGGWASRVGGGGGDFASRFGGGGGGWGSRFGGGGFRRW